MLKYDLILGGIYKTKFDPRSLRIIGLDEFEVFYDCLWSNVKWTFSGNFKVNVTFYRMPVDLFASNSDFIEKISLSEIEHKYFRPDLPMRFGRVKDLSWNTITSEELAHIKSSFKGMTLDTDKIILIPIGQKGAMKKGTLIESHNALTIIDIIKKAITIQTEVNNQQTNGIGIYRLGYGKGLPTYYIGEFLDKAEILK